MKKKVAVFVFLSKCDTTVEFLTKFIKCRYLTLNLFCRTENIYYTTIRSNVIRTRACVMFFSLSALSISTRAPISASTVPSHLHPKR